MLFLADANPTGNSHVAQHLPSPAQQIAACVPSKQPVLLALFASAEEWVSAAMRAMLLVTMKVECFCLCP